MINRIKELENKKKHIEKEIAEEHSKNLKIMWEYMNIVFRFVFIVGILTLLFFFALFGYYLGYYLG
ncbi:MAG: hypothetical protein RL557_1057 [archaeon]|jgi:fatty-acid desaturase